jgi:hypothetical protein
MEVSTETETKMQVDTGMETEEETGMNTEVVSTSVEGGNGHRNKRKWKRIQAQK